jgi:prepilin-type N-terminal cleavage/methylation domain-containing protein
VKVLLNRRSPRDLGSEAGFTLIEILVVVALLVTVLGLLMAPLTLSMKQQSTNENYAFAQQQARTAIESMVAQVRQANAMITTDATSNIIDMNVTLNGSTVQVYYECDVNQPGTSYHECIRVQAAVGSTITSLTGGSVVATNLLNGTAADPVFSLAPSGFAPYYMTATLKVPASDGASTSKLTHTIAFTDGALMRNLNVGN